MVVMTRSPRLYYVIWKLLGGNLACHFGNVLGMNAEVIDIALDVKGFNLRRFPLRFTL